MSIYIIFLKHVFHISRNIIKEDKNLIAINDAAILRNHVIFC